MLGAGSMQAARKSGRPVGHGCQSWLLEAAGRGGAAVRGDGEKARDHVHNSLQRQGSSPKKQGAVLDGHEVAP